MKVVGDFFRDLNGFFRNHSKESTSKPGRIGDVAGEALKNLQNEAAETVFPHLYYVTVKNSNEQYNIYAIKPVISSEGKIQWRDTNLGRSLEAQKIYLDDKQVELVDLLGMSPELHPKKIQITTPEGAEVNFIYVTNENYNAKLRRFTEGQKEFESTEDIQNFYLKNYS